MSRSALRAVFFASGFVALVYEVLWLRDLRLVFGSGAYATATTLAVFFSGMAIGSAVFGRYATRSRDPLALYATLELAIALTALGSFALPSASAWIYRTVVDGLGGGSGALVAARLVLAFVFLLPPTVCLGGTLPVIGEVFIRRPSDLATETARLYALNTIGGALGALVAAFALPMWLGVRGSYGAAIALNLTLAAVAYALARAQSVSEAPAPQAPAGPDVPRWIQAYAFVGGLATIGLEVLWVRMFALVLNSSVYAFGAILVVFLAALSLGAAAQQRLAARLPRELHLFALLLAAGLAIGASPFVLHGATGQLGSIPMEWGFGVYLLLVFGTVALVVLPPAALCGAVLPALLRHCEARDVAPGETIGRVVAANTIGGVVGSLLAGFVLLPVFGLWRTVSIFAFVYLALALFSMDKSAPGARHLRPAALVAAVLLGTFLDPTRLRLVRTDPGETVERVWETPSGIVAVTRDADGRRIRLDNTYILGGTEGRAEEAFQTDLALTLHDDARRVFFLGLGSGITAARALEYPVESVTATELLPEVADASREYFADDAGALFRDARAEVLAADGRTLLATSDATWDVIVSDLFVPWHDAAGALYTREHFANVQERLAPEGLFVQWLPLFQLTRDEFDTIARTLLEVFPHVSFWSGEFRAGEPIAALVASAHAPAAVSPPASARFEGDLTRRAALFADAPLNTDDDPVIEHQAPRSQAAARAGQAEWLVGPELEKLRAELGP